MLIIICGLPGSGKSSFARTLSRELDAHLVSSDLVRKEMEAQGRYVFDDELDVYEEMATEAGRAVRGGNDVVVEATFYRKEMRDMFSMLARLLHQKDVFIRIVSREDLIRERLGHPRPDSQADFSIYRQVKSQYQDLEGDHLVIESKRDNIESMVRKGTDYVRSQQEENVNC
ncbi:MAG: ATP-binding protein [Bacteroidota bacterium]|nr:ATP-binding protein [Bacteroidota bacterium]